MTGSTTQDRDQAEDVAVVEHLMQVLVKGLRAVQLYLPNNPVYQRAIDNVRRATEPVWEQCTDLELKVSETEFAWEDHVVLSQPNKSDSIAWVLYKDGVRKLTVMRGAEDDEIVRFLNVIHKARTLPPEAPDDLLTLLWEQDFQLMRYVVVELMLDDVKAITRSDADTDLGSGSVGAAVAAEEEEEPAVEAKQPESLQQSVRADAEEEEGPTGIIRIEEFDSTLYFLDDDEIAYLKKEIKREYDHDLRANVLAMLFDLLELQTYSTVRAELISILENFIPYLLAVGDFRSVAGILKEIRLVLERAREVLPEHREALENLPAKLSEPDALGQLLQSLDEAHVHPSKEELTELFRELRPEALEAVFEWLPRLTNERVRSLLDAAAQRLAQAHPRHIADALQSDDEAVLLETVRLVSQLKLPPVVPALGELLQKAGPSVKRAVVEALATIGTPGAMQQLEKAIDDADRDVRVGAVRAMAEQGYRGAFPAIEAAVTGKSLRDADLTEKTVFFEAYGALAGSAGLATLEPMLRTKGFMRRKVDPQIRACAAMALGKIATPEVKGILKAAAGDKDPLVRNAVNKALRELG